MKLIFIHGPAASGKFTVGKALQELTGLKLFHNHLVVDTLLQVFPFGSEPFIRLREAMWLSVFEAAAVDGISLIFTFAPEATVDSAFIGKALAAVESRGGTVHFVELTCPPEVQERRIEEPSRAQHFKLRSAQLLKELKDRHAMDFPPLPSSGLIIDTSLLSPAESAFRIREFFALEQ